MPASCPHCHHTLLPDPASGAWPAWCPHCGQATGDVAQRGSSLASFLRAGAPAIATGDGSPATPSSTDLPAASPGPQALSTTPDGALVQDTSPPQDSTPPRDAHDAGPAQTPLAALPATQAAGDEDSTHPAMASMAATAAAADSGPSFMRTPRAQRSAPTSAWQWAGLLILALALCLQLLMADRARLAQDARWRPTLEHVCGALRCSLPAWHQPQAYTMLVRDVQPLAGDPGVLRVRATFRNDARWAQRWPSIALSLSDADGRVAGARVLMPSDYLETTQRLTTLAPGQSGEMTVQVREPPDGVVAFAFEFR